MNNLSLRFQDFVNRPPVFHTANCPRYAEHNRGARCDLCSRLTQEHFAAPNNVDLCADCFILVQRDAANQRRRTITPSFVNEMPTMDHILSVDEKLCMEDFPTCKHNVLFNDGHREVHSALTIYRQLKRQRQPVPRHIADEYERWSRMQQEPIIGPPRHIVNHNVWPPAPPSAAAAAAPPMVFNTKTCFTQPSRPAPSATYFGISDWHNNNNNNDNNSNGSSIGGNNNDNSFHCFNQTFATCETDEA